MRFIANLLQAGWLPGYRLRISAGEWSATRARPAMFAVLISVH